jgi:hypothetical protein
MTSLNSTLAALEAQTDQDWTATVVVDGLEQSDKVRLLIHEYDNPKIRMRILKDRSNDWGHTPRELGKQLSEAQYIIMTGDDNYYVPTFVSELKEATKGNPGLVYWDMVHNHYDYQLFVCSPGFNQIDIGAFATRTDLAKQLGLGTSYAADGEYVEAFKSKFPDEKKVKIKKVLFVHN